MHFTFGSYSYKDSEKLWNEIILWFPFWFPLLNNMNIVI